ncbi:Sigma-70, region 4 [Poriferisphaera corsica]|uniref:Sigma-70, region 4 n=1 Tax=Poriferisphaera corsica TaxID=2528020 RepID=A0A517YS33_9BACT|nr:sigma-70 family RNA polymerase sigma factor [Poriferisphaera corsica]QDU33030.1 Sigma-70, region 4 [Poriferisphaera corsica]
MDTSDGSCIDAFGRKRIAYHARQLQEQLQLSWREREELSQELAVGLLAAMKRFDPAKANQKTFIDRALGRYVLHQKRKLINRGKYASLIANFDDISPFFDPICNDPKQGEFSEQDRIDLRLDLQVVLAKLPERERKIVSLLTHYSISDVAELFGIHRSSMYRIIVRLRERLIRAGLVVFQKQRNKFRFDADIEGEGKLFLYERGAR